MSDTNAELQEISTRYAAEMLAAIRDGISTQEDLAVRLRCAMLEYSVARLTQVGLQVIGKPLPFTPHQPDDDTDPCCIMCGREVVETGGYRRKYCSVNCMHDDLANAEAIRDRKTNL